MSTHLGDELELYALGDLAPEERRAIEAHLAACPECTRALGETEGTLAELAGLLPAYVSPRRARTPVRFPGGMRAALAAAFVAGLLLAGGSLAVVERTASGDSADARAQVAMLHAHFLHVPLAPVEEDAPSVKVIYPSDRKWLYAIADDARRHYRLVAVEGSTTRDLGQLTGHGVSSSLFVERPGEVREVEVLDDDRVVARGILQ